MGTASAMPLPAQPPTRSLWKPSPDLCLFGTPACGPPSHSAFEVHLSIPAAPAHRRRTCYLSSFFRAPPKPLQKDFFPSQSLQRPTLHSNLYLPPPQPTLHIRSAGGQGDFSSPVLYSLGDSAFVEEAAPDSARFFLYLLPSAIRIGQTSTILESCTLITGRLFSSLLTGSSVYYSGISTVTEKQLD